MDSKRSHRIFFLIDVSLASCEKCNHSNEIILSVFRLLSLFSGAKYQSQIQSNENDLASQTKSPKESLCRTAEKYIKPRLVWGFKFFSLNSTLPRNKSYKCTCHNDFNSDVMELFEQRLNQAFDTSVAPGIKRKSLSHPSEYLMTAFRDILHEFEWQDPDPILTKASLRLSSAGPADVCETVQHVFLFAPVPSSKQCLRKFCNKVVLDSEVFVDSVMSPTLFAEYIENMKICTSWVDLSSSECNSSKMADSSMSYQNTYHHSISIVKESMQKLGGALLHKDFLIHRIPTFVDPLNLKENETFQTPRLYNLLPSESLLHSLLSFTKQSTEHTAEISCPLTLSGSLVDTSMKLLSLEKSRVKGVQKPDSSNTAQDHVSSLQKSNCDIDFNCAEFELIGFVSSAAISESLNFVDILASYLLNCDNDPLMTSLLHHLFSTNTFGILRLHTKSQSRERVYLALMSANALDVGFVSLLTPTACLKVADSDLKLPDSVKTIASISRNHETNFSKIFYQLEETLQEGKKETAQKPQNSPCKVSELFDSQTLNSWHIPGTNEYLGTIINRLNESLQNQDHSLERNILKELKKRYFKEKQPYQVSSTPKVSATTPVDEMSLSKLDVSGGSESDRRSSLDRSHRRSGGLTRGRMMVDRARSTSLSFFDDSEGSQSSKQGNFSRRASDSTGFSELNLITDGCLAEYLLKQYNQVLGAGVAMEAAIQAMMTVACHFMSNKQMNNPQREAVSFIRKQLAKESNKLKEKYDKTKFEGKAGQDVIEYKLQVILLLEMESFLPESDRSPRDKIVNNLISMLRPLSFACGITELRTFLESLTTSYSGTLPQILVEVHDELDQPYPADLARFASPSAPSSVWGPSLSVRSDDLLSAPGSSQPPSNQQSQSRRSSRVSRHPSFADFGQKKQILVNKPESKSKSKVDGKKTTKDKGERKENPHRTRRGSDYDRAKRNLFNDKTKVTPRKRKDRRQLTPQRKREKVKVLVPGTPAHKQTSKRIIRRQQKLREHFNIKPDVQVVEESPVKDDGNQKDNRPAKLIVRQSFYSTNAGQSRNVAKSLEASKDESSQWSRQDSFMYKTRSQGSLASAVRGESPMLSPRSRIIKSFCTSPSSGEKSDGTPRSHNVRRSPRKSVKKLNFADCLPDGSKKETINPRLVFDGENASDIQLVSHNSVSEKVEGFQTPEKNKNRTGMESMQGAASLPSFTVSSFDSRMNYKPEELNFKNAFSHHQGSLLQKDISKPSTSSTHVSSPNRFHNSVTQPHFSSPDQAAKLRSSFLQSPKRKSPAKVNLSFSDNDYQTKHQSIPMSFRSPTKNKTGTSPGEKQRHLSNCADEAVVYSTPQKLRHSGAEIQFTPSKVTFSDSVLSPPNVSSRPPSAQKMTPRKSILKNSPAFKANIMKKIQQPSFCDEPIKNSDYQVNENNEKSIPPSRKKETEAGSSLDEENMPRSHTIKRRVLSFDGTASSSSNENSNHVHPHAGPTTVITVHSPSPTKRAKTPDVNKWMRKKRHSGSRTCSSSSSSPSLFSSSPSSAEGKLKDLSTQSSSSTMDQSDSVRNSPKQNVANISVAEDLHPARGKSLKRNLFSTDDAQTSRSKVKRVSEKGSHDSVLPTIHSGGFDPKSESLLGIKDKEPLPAIPFGRNTRSRASSTLSQDNKKSFAHLLPHQSSSSFESPHLSQHLSSYALDGSQGFQVQASPSSSHHKKTFDGLDSSSWENSPKPQNRSETPEWQQLSQGTSHSQSEAKKTPTKTQFSPALSSSGLLHLIRSPLLDKGAKKKDIKKEGKRRKGRSKDV